MTTKKKSNQDALKILEDLAGEKLTLGNFIHAIRKGEGMTQIGFAQLLGVSKQYLCDVERGRRCISPKAAESFAKKLGYSPEQFVRLCLQDMVDKEGVCMVVNIDAA